MYKAVVANKRNTVMLMAVFAGIVGAIGWVFAWLYSDMSIFTWTLIIATVYAIIQYFAASKLAVAMTGAKKIERKDNPKLWHVVEVLSINTGLPMPEVYVVDDPAPNAFATGRDPKHAIVAATTGLLDIMDETELTAVMAHEMSHVQNYDTRVSMIVFGLVSVIGLITDIGVRMLWGGSNNRDRSPIVLIVGLAVMILAPFVALMVRLAVSRQREYLADGSAVLITRYPQGMVDALKKLETAGKPMQRQNSATEALYINEPMKPSWLSGMFSTHPPLESRIERIQKNEKRF